MDQQFIDAQGLLDGDEQQAPKGFGDGAVFAAQHDDEFIAAHTSQNMSARRQHHAHAPGHPGNHLVTGGVTEGRIDLAESIEIDPQGGEGQRLALGSGEHPVCGMQATATIEEAGDWVDNSVLVGHGQGIPE